jgi:hypothetical protein
MTPSRNPKSKEEICAQEDLTKQSPRFIKNRGLCMAKEVLLLNLRL